MNIYAYGRSAASAAERQNPRQKLWDVLRDKVGAEHRGLETSDPTSPRIKPTLATAIGWVLR
jgi:hypothetical protein